MSDENNDWAENPFETEGQSSGFIVAEDDYYLYILTEKKVIAFIVEGASDEAALGTIMKEYFTDNEVQFVVIRGRYTPSAA